MASLATMEKGLGSLESQMSQYTSDLPSQLKSEVQKAVTPTLDKYLGQTTNIMSEGLPQMINAATAGPWGGTTAADLSPAQKLSSMGRTMGNWTGRLSASQDMSDYLGGQMNDMYKNAVTAMQMGQQNLADKYGRAFQQYQTALQVAEAKKDRQLQRSLSGGSGGGSYTINLGGGEQTPTKTSTIPAHYQQMFGSMEMYLKQLGNKAITKEERRERADDIIKSILKIYPGMNDYMTQSVKYNAYNLAGFSDKWNPATNNW